MNNITQYEDEISLIDLVKILIKWKYIILSVFITVVAASFIYLSTKKAIYESRSVIAIGNYGANNQLIEKASSLKRRLQSSYQIDEPDYGNLQKYPYPKLVFVNTERNSEDFVTLVAQSYSPQEAQSYLQAEVDKLIVKHAKDFSKVMSAQVELLNSQSDLIKSMKDEVDNFGELVKEINKKDSTQAVLLKVEQLKFNESLPKLNILINELAFKINSAKETQVIKMPVLNDNPVKPRRLLIIAIGIMLGLFVGIFSAFFVEFLMSIRKQLAKN